MRILSRSLMMVGLATAVVVANAALGEAQTYRFQLQPFCNKVTLTLLPSSSGSVAGVVGYDDNCGEERSPVHGSAILTPDGGFSIGYTTNYPCGCGSHTTVEWGPNASSGSWTDSDGNSGSYIYDVLDQPSG